MMDTCHRAGGGGLIVEPKGVLTTAPQLPVTVTPGEGEPVCEGQDQND